jgi:hypothetical protein
VWTSSKRSTTDQISCIREIRKTSEYNGTVHQPFVNFKKGHDSVRREILYIILIIFLVTMKWPKRGGCSNTTAFQLCFGICH